MSFRMKLAVVSTVLVLLGVGAALVSYSRQPEQEAQQRREIVSTQQLPQKEELDKHGGGDLKVGGREENRPSDLEKLQGMWNLVRSVSGGESQEIPPGEGTIVIKGTRLQWPTPADSWTITLRPEQNPKWFDYRGNIPHPNPGLLPSNTDIVYRGIYRLENETLTICVFRGGKEKQFEKYRPTNFESTPGSGVYLKIYKRKTP